MSQQERVYNLSLLLACRRIITLCLIEILSNDLKNKWNESINEHWLAKFKFTPYLKQRDQFIAKIALRVMISK